MRSHYFFFKIVLWRKKFGKRKSLKKPMNLKVAQEFLKKSFGLEINKPKEMSVEKNQKRENKKPEISPW